MIKGMWWAKVYVAQRPWNIVIQVTRAAAGVSSLQGSEKAKNGLRKTQEKK